MAALNLSRSTWDLLLWLAGFSSCDAQALEHEGSVVVACKLSCPVACGILVPGPGIEPVSPALEGRFLTTGPPGKSVDLFFFVCFPYVTEIRGW